MADLAREMGEVRPIELQVVGAQLQADKITRLEDYRALGDNPKQELVKRYLEEVVADCGAENRELAEWVLYLLTDEKGTRPLKTRSELEKELQALATGLDDNPDSLDLVLKIMVDSGLVVLLPEVPEDRYQLVHDYLAAFIRQQQEPRLNQLMAELKQAREQRQQSDAKLNRFLKRALIGSIIAGIGLAALASIAFWSANQANQEKQQAEAQRQRAEVNELETMIKSAEVLSASGQGLDALIASLRVVQRQRSLGLTESSDRTRTAGLLQQTLYGINEQNSLDRHTNPVRSVSFSPDGKTLATASADNTVKLWSLNLDDLIKQSCQWSRNYLATHISVVEELQLCQNPSLLAAAADTLILDASELARQGNITSAITKFDQAKTWNSKFTFNSQLKAQQLANQGKAAKLIADISNQAQRGEIREALADAQKLDPQVKIPIDTWDVLCWYGSLYGLPDRVLFACEKAVALAPKDELGYYRDSRGIARAIMGDAKGAISDFEAYLQWQKGDDKDAQAVRARRQRWIQSLRRAPNRNPFTPEDMKQLLE